jgi:branched-chain amino acid transport system ATP-binding protein
MSGEPDGRILEVEDLQAFYGLSHVLHGISLSVAPGEAVAVLGRNGAGKTTLLKAIAGVLEPRGGRVRFESEDITGLPPYEIVKRRIAWVPEERRIFPNLTVYENLKMSRLVVDRGKHLDQFLDRVFTLFPRLAERIEHKGRQLSGGEQQMLTIARGLGCEPRLLLIDEPTEGLMPELVRAIADTMATIQREGVAVLLVEQNVRVALETTRRTYLIEQGSIRWEGLSADLARDYDTRRRYLGV